jgi:hypothetical protein
MQPTTIAMAGPPCGMTEKAAKAPKLVDMAAWWHDDHWF